MYSNKPPAARRLAQFPQQLADGGMVARMKSADAGPATFGSRGLSQLRDMIPKMQAMGYPQQAAAAPAAADPRAAQLQAMIPQVEAMGYKQQPQRLADGGFVSAAKRMMGLTPEDPARAAALAEYKANAAREKAAAKAASAPATAPAPKAAISQYSGMSAMQRREKEQGLADGGMIRGPGTGTSDSIPDEMEPGTYIMPADSTKQLGLDDKKVPVRVSNGEYELPPEQVQAVGAAVLDAIKGVTHTPKSLSARGLQSPQDEQFFATGGSVRDPEELRKMIPQVEAMGYAQSPAAAPAPGASASQSLAQRVSQIPAGGQTAPAADGSQNSWANTETGRNLSNIASALPGSLGGAIPAVAKTGGAISGGIDAATRLLNAGVGAAAISAIPGAASAQGATPSTIASPPTSQTNPAAAPASTSLANAGRGTVNPPMANPSAPAPTNVQAPGGTNGNVTRVGNSYSGTNVSGDITVNGQAPRGGFMVADGARGFSPGGSAAAAPQGVTAPTVLHSGNSWQARNELRNAQVSASSIMNNGGRWDQHGKGVVSPERAAYLAMLGTDQALRQAQPAADVMAMRENAGIQREGMQQDGATTRTGMTEQGANARESGRNILARDEFNLRKEASGFQTRAAQQQEQLRNVLLDPKSTPEQRAVAQRNLAALSGKTAADRMQTVTLPDTTNEMGQVVRGGQALVRTLEDGTVQQVPIGAQQGAAPAPQAMPKPASKAEFDALPKGTRFTDPNGQVRIK